MAISFPLTPLKVNGLTKAARITGRFIKVKSPYILGLFAAAGVVATPVLAVRASRKEEPVDKSQTKKEKVAHFVKTYKVPIIAGAVTIACMTGTNVIQTVRLTKTVAALEKSSEQIVHMREALGAAAGAGSAALAEKVRKKDIPEELKKEIEADTDNGDEKCLFYDIENETWFRATFSDLHWAMYWALEHFENYAALSVENFYASLGEDCPKDREGFGWVMNDEHYDNYGTFALSFDYDEEPRYTDDGLEYRYFYFEQPPAFYKELLWM